MVATRMLRLYIPQYSRLVLW